MNRSRKHGGSSAYYFVSDEEDKFRGPPAPVPDSDAAADVALKWKRSGSYMKDQLHLFKTGELHDCTIKVGNGLAGGIVKEFRCHKLVLSVSSSVFEAMFFGDGAKRDEPIQLNDVSVSAFKCAMRFVYGEQTNFGDEKMAIEVYKFAHKMKMDGLTAALDCFLLKRMTPSTVLEIYQHYKSLDHAVGLRTAIAMVQEEAKKVFKSPFWLTASEDLVRDVMDMDNLNVAECDVVRALVKWGKAQEMPLGVKQLRSKLVPLLKLIRFTSLELADFVQLSTNELKDVLTAKEKSAIQSAIELKNWTLMPAKFTPLKASRFGYKQSTARVHEERVGWSECGCCDTLLY